MQTEGVSHLGLDGQNYTVAAVQRRVGVRSNIAGIFVNRQGFQGNSLNMNDYNRVAGVDFNLASKIIHGEERHSTTTPSHLIWKKAFAHAVWLMYNSQNLQAHYNHEVVGENYNAEVGFVPRLANYNPGDRRNHKQDLLAFRAKFNL